MNLRWQRKLDQYLGPLLCWLLSAWPWQRRASSMPTRPERILVILLSEMGSLVLTYPMWTYLKHKYPAAEFYALVFQPNREMLELLQVLPSAHILTLRPTSLGTLWRDSLQAIRQLRQRRIDTVLDCELFARACC